MLSSLSENSWQGACGVNKHTHKRAKPVYRPETLKICCGTSLAAMLGEQLLQTLLVSSLPQQQQTQCTLQAR